METEKLAIKLYEAGAVQFGEYILKMHEEYPNAPKSPVYINLRIPPKGKLTEKDIEKIGTVLWETACANEISFDHIVGLPKAGEPLAKAFVKASGRDISLLRLEKEETEKGRKILPIIHGDYKQGEVVLVIDDLITKADTKLEGIEAIRSNGLKVNDCLVFLDREQGGKEQLSQAKVRLIVILAMSALLTLYVEKELITSDKRQEVIDYQLQVEEYMRQQ